MTKFNAIAAMQSSKTDQSALLSKLKNNLASWGVKVEVASKCKQSTLAAKLCAVAHAVSD